MDGCVRVFKTRAFSRWSGKLGVSDAVLLQVANELVQGLFEASLGGCVYKKRLPLSGRGKQSGARSIIVYRSASSLFFVYGFAKNEQGNIDSEELDLVKRLASKLLGYSEKQINYAITNREIIEVLPNAEK